MSEEALTPGWRFVTPLALGSALNPINSSIIATALVPIGTAFHVGLSTTAGLVAILYLASSIGQPTMGKLAEHFGPRRVFLAGLALILAGGVVGTLAVNIPMLLVARLALGLGTSTGYPTAMVIVRRWAERHPSAQIGGTLGALAIAGQVTAAIGLPLGGALVAAAGWRITFLINIPLALIGAAMALRWVPRDAPTPARTDGSLARALDPIGLALFAGAMACLLFFLNDLHDPHWLLAALVVVLLAALIGWERRAPNPFIDVRMLARNKALDATYLRVAVTFLLTYCIFYGLTQWLEDGRGLSSSAVGLVMLPMSLLAAVISVPFARRNSPRIALVATAIAALVGSAGLLLFTSDSPVWILVLVIMVFGVTSGLGMIGNQAALYHQAPSANIGVAAGLMRTFTYVGAILSASLISLAFGDRATDHGLHTVVIALLGISVVLLVLTAFVVRRPVTAQDAGRPTTVRR